MPARLHATSFFLFVARTNFLPQYVLPSLLVPTSVFFMHAPSPSFLSRQPAWGRERGITTLLKLLCMEPTRSILGTVSKTQDTRCVLRDSSMGTKNERVSSRRGEARPAQPPLAPKVVYSTLSWYVA